MDAPRLPGPDAERRYGRRVTDAGSATRFYAAAFVAQVAGLSLPSRPAPRRYDTPAPTPPNGLVTNFRA